jgi:hypothetical protein
VFIPIGQLAAVASPWDVSPWDTSPWSAERAVEAQWQVASGDGSVISFALATQAFRPLTWLRTDFRIEPGRAL